MKRLLVALLFPVSLWAAQTSYYVGEIRILSPQGEMQSLSLALNKRTLDAELKIIIDEILHVAGDGKPDTMTLVSQVTGNRFTQTDTAKRLRGTGTLTGKPWNWNRWEVSGMIDENRRYTSRAHITDGNLLVRKEFFDANGKLKNVFSEEYRAITRELYELLHAKLTRAKNPVS